MYRQPCFRFMTKQLIPFFLPFCLMTTGKVHVSLSIVLPNTLLVMTNLIFSILFHRGLLIDVDDLTWQVRLLLHMLSVVIVLGGRWPRLTRPLLYAAFDPNNMSVTTRTNRKWIEHQSSHNDNSNVETGGTQLPKKLLKIPSF